MTAPVAVLGGSGFVGRFLLERWPDAATPLRFLVHRSRPEWLRAHGVDVRPIDLAQPQEVKAELQGAGCLINLLRPDGSGWLRDAMQRLLPALGEGALSRIVHTSSVDVFGGTRSDYVTDDTQPQPFTAYEREHVEIERVVEDTPFETCIVRPGAIFGRGGRNIVGFVPEVRSAPIWKLAARRSLYGKRRMHLVSVENVADALHRIATSHDRPWANRILITDDDAPENNFAFVQEALAKAFDRPTLGWVPETPNFLLRAALIARGRTNAHPARRYAGDNLVATGFRPEQPFAARISRYVASLGTDDAILATEI